MILPNLNSRLVVSDQSTWKLISYEKKGINFSILTHSGRVEVI